jgi:hypothetical protein
MSKQPGAGKAQKKGSKHVEPAPATDDTPAGQLKQLQQHFLRFKDKAAKKRVKVWSLFEEHIKKHGETPSTRIFKARCLLLEMDDGNDAARAKKAATFREYMHTTYLAAQGPPHSITALCMFAHFLNGEYNRRENTNSEDATSLTTLKRFLEDALNRVKVHGANFVDPSLEVMEAKPSLQWEKCDAPDPRLQILHRIKWLRGISDEVGKVYDNAIQNTRRREHPEMFVHQLMNANLESMEKTKVCPLLQCRPRTPPSAAPPRRSAAPGVPTHLHRAAVPTPTTNIAFWIIQAASLAE